MQDCTRGYRSPREWGAKKPPAILCNIRIGMVATCCDAASRPGAAPHLAPLFAEPGITVRPVRPQRIAPGFRRPAPPWRVPAPGWDSAPDIESEAEAPVQIPARPPFGSLRYSAFDTLTSSPRSGLPRM